MKVKAMLKSYSVIALLVLTVWACRQWPLQPIGLPPMERPFPTPIPSNTITCTPTPSLSPTPTWTGTATLSPTRTRTPSPTPTLSPIPTPVCTMQPTSTPVIETADFGGTCSYASYYNLGTLTSGDAVIEGNSNPTTATDTDGFYFTAGSTGTWTFVVDCTRRDGQYYTFTLTNAPDATPYGCVGAGQAWTGPTFTLSRTLSAGVTYAFNIYRNYYSGSGQYRITVLAP